MIVLVPVSRFRITYEVGAGRPFSYFEQTILDAIHQGASVLEDLQEIFCVHPRLLVEGLVTLTQAGWIAVGGPGHEGFVLTSEGREAAESDRAPSTTAVSQRRAFVVLERLTGGLISNDEVRFLSKRDLESVWDQSRRLRPQVPDNRLDEGQVQHLLPRRQGEWVRWIGPIDMVSRDAHWLAANVDLDAGTVVGVPDAWVTRLRAAILEEAKRVASSLTKDERTRVWKISERRTVSAESVDRSTTRIPTNGWRVALSEADFCVSSEDHANLLTRALNGACSSLFVSSAFVSVTKLEALRLQIEATLERGVSIDLLWGDEANRAKPLAADWLTKLAYSARRDGVAGAVRFNKLCSGVHANLLLWDEVSGFRACVGSYNWLGASNTGVSAGHPRDLSATISDRGAVAAVARCAAAFWSAGSAEVLTSTGDRWRRIAAELDMEASRSEPSATNAIARIVLDREHEALLNEWSKSTQRRLLIASHQLGAAGGDRIVRTILDHADGARVDAYYGRAGLEDAELARVAGLVREAGGSLTHVPDLHAKVLLGDIAACITSYDFLAPRPSGAPMKPRDLGLVVEGSGPLDLLSNVFLRHFAMGG